MGMNCQPVFVGRLNQRIAEILVVRVCGKDDLSVVAALDDMLRLLRNDVTGKARHDELDSGAQDRARIPLIIVSDPIMPSGFEASPSRHVTNGRGGARAI